MHPGVLVPIGLGKKLSPKFGDGMAHVPDILVLAMSLCHQHSFVQCIVTHVWLLVKVKN